MFREFQLPARGRQDHPRNWVQECGVLSLPLSVSQVLLPLSGLTSECSQRTITFPVISRQDPIVLSVIFLHTVDPFITSTSRFTEIHLVLFSKLFPLTAVLSKFTKHTHNKISVAPRKQIHRFTIYVASCCGSRNRTRRSTADNYQRLMIPAKGSLINI